MSRRTLPTTPHASLSHVGHTLDEDLPRINDNYEKIDAQLAQAFTEREALRISTSEANTLLGQQVNEKLQAEHRKNAEKNTTLLNTVNTAIKGITTKQEDFSAKVQQEEEALEKKLTDHASLELEDSAHAFPKGKEGQMLTIKEGKLVFAYTYPLCEVKTWRHPTLKTGFVPAQGGLIEKAKERYPDAWEYLQTEEGQLLCVTEDEWQAMTTAVYYMATSKGENDEDVIKEFSFDGVGGAPFYVQDIDAGTLRVPDLRGMYAEASGFDGLETGGTHLDMERVILGDLDSFYSNTYGFIDASALGITGAFYKNTHKRGAREAGGNGNGIGVCFDSSRVVPTGNANKPRAWGALVCVFLGTPQPISEAEHDANNA